MLIALLGSAMKINSLCTVKFLTLLGATMSSCSLSKYIALLIRRGVNNVEELASILNVSEDDVKEKLLEMESKGLVKCSKKGFWRHRRMVCSLTSKGLELAEEAEKELIEIRRRVAEEAEREV